MPERQLRMIRRHLDGLPEISLSEGYGLRTFAPGDEQTWCDIMNTGIGDGWTVDRCREQLTGQDRFLPDALYFATFEGRPVGAACVWPDAPGDLSRAQVHMVCVVPEHRNRRLGHLLTLAVLRHMKTKGFGAAYLFTDDFRIPAIKAYLRLGFEPDYVEENHRLRWARILPETGNPTTWWRHVRPEPLSCGIRETTGNLSVLVVLDGSQREACERARRTVIAAFNHYGIPYRTLDLAVAREPSQSITRHQAIVLAQENIGNSLSGVLAKQIVRAVSEGAGFIGFDHRIDRYPEPLRPLIPVESQHTMHEAEGLSVPTGDHFAVGMRHTERRYRLRKPVELTCAVVSGGRVLVETGEQMPALIAGRYGGGRIVQYFVSPRLWDQAYFGHGEGLDDVFWRSVVWAARKPFVTQSMPACISLRIDHATGAADGFAYLHTLTARGWWPHVGFLADRLDPAAWRTLSQLTQDGSIECFPQSFSDREGIFFDLDHASYSDEAFASRTARLKALLDEYRVPISRTFNPYRGEYGRNVLSFLAEQGVRWSLTPCLPDEPDRTAHVNWEPAPYGHPGFIFDVLPGFPEIFVTTADVGPRDRTDETETRKYIWINDGPEDFLEPAFSASRTMNMVDKAVRAARGGLDARFFGSIALKERDIVELAPDEWETVLDHLDHLVREYGATRMSQDDVGRYARSRTESQLSHAAFDRATGEVVVIALGKADVPLQLQIFDEDCLEHTVMIDTFEGRLEERFRYE